MNAKGTFLGLSLSQAIGFISFLLTIISIWVHLEVKVAELNVDITNLKQDLMVHKEDNRKDIESLRNDIKVSSEQILTKVDEIQIYLRNKK